MLSLPATPFLFYFVARHHVTSACGLLGSTRGIHTNRRNFPLLKNSSLAINAPFSTIISFLFDPAYYYCRPTPWTPRTHAVLGSFARISKRFLWEWWSHDFCSFRCFFVFAMQDFSHLWKLFQNGFREF
ncbi:hypothetical protein L596_023943 [Steinernema carpocapsae]|uniref:Uncharacterized protein n=1 Tax=Steinernema carpocapsae TaxID=34508 RepID=A0A4U5MF75_STECR|nr:hypothetical protein L596_023943 [Steinernema carpocapsae]